MAFSSWSAGLLFHGYATSLPKHLRGRNSKVTNTVSPYLTALAKKICSLQAPVSVCSADWKLSTWGNSIPVLYFAYPNNGLPKSSYCSRVAFETLLRRLTFSQYPNIRRIVESVVDVTPDSSTRRRFHSVTINDKDKPRTTKASLVLGSFTQYSAFSGQCSDLSHRLYRSRKVDRNGWPTRGMNVTPITVIVVRNFDPSTTHSSSHSHFF